MRGEQPAHQPGQRFAIPRRQALEHRQDVGFEAGRGLGHERPAVAGEADQHNPPVRDRRNAHDQAASLSAVDQARDAGLVESEQPRQVVHGRGAVAQHSKQARLDDRETVLRGPVLEHALNHEGELSQPVDGAQLLTRSHARSLLALVRDTN
jgi:hypothetical protein